MCAIMGIIDKYNNHTEKKIINDMQAILKHRGPNDSGTTDFSFKGQGVFYHCMVGFNRLSIRDLSDKGHQPMANDNGDILIAFNGEIYNSEELRPDLIAKGYKFNSTTDTEVLLKLYQEYGIDKTLSMLDGMFGICLIDKRKDCIYLVRDRFGEKPLYFYENNEVFMFASEYKAFYSHPSFTPQLNEEGVDEYFMFRYVSDGETLLKNVFNMTPGSYLKITNNEIVKTQYWDFTNVEPNKLNYKENKEKFKLLLEKSIRRRLISDKPVGVQLSGGVDSSVVTAMVTQFKSDKLKTFGVTSPYEEYNEQKYIEYVNKKLKLEGHEYLFTSDKFFESWLQTTWFFENPMNVEGSVGLLFLNHYAEKEVSVMLCGEGADELLGYPELTRLCSLIHHKSFLLPIAYAFMYAVNRIKAGHKIPNLLNMENLHIFYSHSVPIYMFHKIRPQRKNALNEIYQKRRKILAACSGKGIRKYQNYDMKTFLLDCLHRADKVSMASSLELRVPFLMTELVEFICSIPERFLIKELQGGENRNLKKLMMNLIKRPHELTSHIAKYVKGTPEKTFKIILKDICSEMFGEEFTYRKKVGFQVPILEYFQDKDIATYVENQLLPGIKRRKVVDYDVVVDAWNKKSIRKDMHNVLWTTLSFEMWAQMYLDTKPGDWQEKVAFKD